MAQAGIAMLFGLAGEVNSTGRHGVGKNPKEWTGLQMGIERLWNHVEAV